MNNTMPDREREAFYAPLDFSYLILILYRMKNAVSTTVEVLE